MEEPVSSLVEIIEDEVKIPEGDELFCQRIVLFVSFLNGNPPKDNVLTLYWAPGAVVQVMDVAVISVEVSSDNQKSGTSEMLLSFDDKFCT